MYFPCLSDRAKKLYEALKPYLKDGMAIMDIGCAVAPIAYYVKQDFNGNIDYLGWDKWGEALQHPIIDYPQFRWKHWMWTLGDLSIFDKRYDILIHIGIDSWKISDSWKIHGEILSQGNLMPDYVLLESGLGRATYPWCYQSYLKVCRFYKKAGYKVVEKGIIDFSINPLPERHYKIYQKGQ